MGLSLTTTHPEVLAAIERNEASLAEFRRRVHAWATERGSDTVMMSGWGRLKYVTGLPQTPAQSEFGRWTTPGPGGRSRPFKSNTEEHQAFQALRWEAEPVPGLPEMVHSLTAFATGQTWIMYPTPLIVEGAAWVEYPHPVDPDDLKTIDLTIWTECLGSAYLAASEKRIAAAKAGS